MRERFVVLGMLAGTFLSFLLGIFDPRIVNKAGPDWLWRGGRADAIRNLFFRPDGAFRRYGRIALLGTVFGGTLALHWLLQLM